MLSYICELAYPVTEQVQYLFSFLLYRYVTNNNGVPIAITSTKTTLNSLPGLLVDEMASQPGLSQLAPATPHVLMGF